MIIRKKEGIFHEKRFDRAGVYFRQERFHEYASREYSLKLVKKMIEHEREAYGWEFVFLGANIDAVRTAGQFGINSDRAADYLPDAAGTALNFAVMAEAVAQYREENCISARHFDRIRRDVKSRGGKANINR